MVKLILLVAIIYAIFHFFIKPKPIQDKKTTKEEQDEDIMVECAKCKTYVSSKEAIIKNGKYYCSKECAKDDN